ncbi:hypothetical protein [Priestia flexa]|uniref:hypothetical protein n=1 Tax=Priestia flexa TaxID=86664 RepID=UPI001CFD6935|nr:hypothetical protein [Priestia flexa]
MQIKKNDLFELTIILFLFFSTIYGILSIFINDNIFRVSKDIFLLFFILLGISVILFKQKGKLTINVLSLILIVALLINIGSINQIKKLNFFEIFYSLKIFMLPILGFFVGVLLAHTSQRNQRIKKFFIISLIIILIGWIIQYLIGIDRLVAMGFVYGTNVEHFNGKLRLSSTIGTPDTYAFFLALVLTVIQSMCITKTKYKFIFFVFSFLILFLTFIRSALLFWIIAQASMFVFNQFSKGLSNKIYVTPFVAIGMLGVAKYITLKTDITSTASVQDRFSHWGNYVPHLFSVEWLVGLGLGTVGAAGRKLSENYNSLATIDYAVDNQFLAIFLQTGAIGVFLFILLYITLFSIASCAAYKELLLGLLTASLFSSFFTNILELYPFNLWLFFILGYFYTNKQREVETINNI